MHYADDYLSYFTQRSTQYDALGHVWHDDQIWNGYDAKTTIANQVTIDPVSGVALPLHNALMRNLGITLTETAWLEDLAADCAEDRQYTFLYTAAPLKIVNRTGAPVNPVVIK